MTSREVKISELAIPEIWSALKTDAEYIVLAGGRASGKTFTTALFLLVYMTQNPNFNILVIRENFTNLRGSIYEDFIEAATKLEIDAQIIARKIPLEIRLPAGNAVVFAGLKDPQKLKGLKKANKKFAYCVFEEAQNIPDYASVRKAEHTAFRGQDNGTVIVIMNTDVKNWVYDTFFDKAKFYPKIAELEAKGYMKKRMIDKKRKIDWLLFYCNIYLNPFLTQRDLRRYEFLRENDYKAYLIDGLGIWGDAKGVVWDCADKAIWKELTPETVLKGDWEHTFTVDYGEVNSATVCLHTITDKTTGCIYLIDCYYYLAIEQGRKTPFDYVNDIVNFIEMQVKNWNIRDFLGIVDSAADMFRYSIIKELQLRGYQSFTFLPTLNKNGNAGKTEIIEGVTLAQTLMSIGRFYINKNGYFDPLVKEFQRQVWEEQANGKFKIKDAYNDVTDCIRYACMNRYETLIYKRFRELEGGDDETILFTGRQKNTASKHVR